MLAIRQAEDRGVANFGWLKSHHTFSFGNYYDPEFMSPTSWQAAARAGYRSRRAVRCSTTSHCVLVTASRSRDQQPSTWSAHRRPKCCSSIWVDRPSPRPRNLNVQAVSGGRAGLRTAWSSPVIDVLRTKQMVSEITAEFRSRCYGSVLASVGEKKRSISRKRRARKSGSVSANGCPHWAQ